MARLMAVVVAVAALVAGCTQGEGMPSSAMTQDQAVARVEQLIHDTAATLTPTPRLDLYRPSLNVQNCLEPTDGGSEDRIIINRTYFLRDIPKAKVSAVAGQVQAYWKRQGHLIQAVSKTGTSISGRSQPDDFLLSLSLTGDDVLTLGAGSPCIWPSGTPDPTAQAS
ncbi:hypothetical protein [Sphaerisporangium rhizosphaerae]|uniref:DUF3558 domain-containing protein n=1 Tax=Sphaerisporangium rhizosphaerae TaxID=2269375 RepID=A0ABW2NYC8_9ACTN